MPAKSVRQPDTVHQLKVTLRDIKPPIWRRVLVPSRFSLYKLHRVIQIAMGWTDSHLHQFIIDGQYYSIPSSEDWEPVIDERRHSLGQIANAVKRRFIYEYDFGDSWEHEVVAEKILPREAGVKYPLCLKGERACPPEDVGGIWGYETFLEAIQNPRHEEHASYLEWIGGAFDSEAFNLDEVNQALRRVR